MTGPAQPLLQHLRAHLRDAGVAYAEPPGPISGGYDTQIFGFRLSGAAGPFSAPLILRVLARHHPPARVVTERVVQNVVAGLGFPAPRVLLDCTDPDVLGAPFLVMERVAGRPLIDARRIGIASVLVDMHLHLHALDAETLLQALDREGQVRSDASAPPPGHGDRRDGEAQGERGGREAPRFGRDVVTLEGFLARLEHRIARGPLRGLEQAMVWLLAHRPTDARGRVICHGDFHPGNILMHDGQVTGVIDWPNTVVADPEFDVASTRTILALVPVEILGVPPLLRALVDVARRILLASYMRGYQRRRPLDPSRLAYHEALACIRGLVRTAEARLGPPGAAGLNTLDASVYGERLAARLARITGVTPTLPPAPTRAR